MCVCGVYVFFYVCLIFYNCQYVCSHVPLSETLRQLFCYFIGDHICIKSSHLSFSSMELF